LPKLRDVGDVPIEEIGEPRPPEKTDDLELLVKVLEAKKPFFAKANRLLTEVLMLTQTESAPFPAGAETSRIDPKQTIGCREE
jgi:hypothetical protein